MKRVFKSCLSLIFKPNRKQKYPGELKETIENPSTSNVFPSEESKETVENPSSSNVNNGFQSEESEETLENPSTSNVGNGFQYEESKETIEKPSASNVGNGFKSADSKETIENPSTGNVSNGFQYEVPKETMENPSTSNVGNVFQSEKSEEGPNKSTNNLATNIILNHDFSGGLYSWHPNCCKAFVASANFEGISAKSDSHYAVVTNRKERWQGLEQDVTSRVSPGSTYNVSASVGVSGPLLGFTDVLATLKLEYRHAATSYLPVARTYVCKGKWEKLEGTFSLSTVPDRVVFYLEGPSPGVDLLIESVLIYCPSHVEFNRSDEGPNNSRKNVAANIILNHDFSVGLDSWRPNCCQAFVALANVEGISAKSGSRYALVTKRKERWQGLEQDITSRVSPGSTYTVSASVGVSGPLLGFTDVLATLKLEYQYAATSYLPIARTSVGKEKWEKLEGTFSLSNMPDRVVFYLEGPSPEVDLLIESVLISCPSRNEFNLRDKF